MTVEKAIEVSNYNDNWPKQFEAEAIVLKNALKTEVLDVHHIGSTAVPGLCAKPKIDIIAVVKNLQQARPILEGIGYAYRGEYNIPMHGGYTKRKDVDINLHVYETGHPEIELNLTFRDMLRSDPNLRDAYGQLKLSLLEDETSYQRSAARFPNYTLRKRPFINDLLRKAGYARVRMLKCSDDEEWKVAKYFRDTYFFTPYGIEDPYTWTFNNNDHAHLLWCQGVDIVGYAHVQFWKDERAAIRIIVIDDSKTRVGHGSQFLKVIGVYVENLGFKSLHVESRKNSLNYYLKNGYTPMPFNCPDGYESDADDIQLGKILSR